MSNLEGNIKIVKDDAGHLYWPELNINTIVDMEPGEGYVLKVIDDQLFNYPSNSDYVNDINGPTSSARFGINSPRYYDGFDQTSSNMIVGIPHDSWNDFDIETGDELAVFDTQGNLVGASILNQDNNVLVIWEDDPASDEKDGMIHGEDLDFELWKSSSNEIYDLKFDWKEGVDSYSSNGVNIVSSILVEQNQANSIDGLYCFPNPSSSNVNLDFYLKNDENLSISVLNAIGKEVYKIDNRIYDSGLNQLTLSLSHLRQGLYFIELKSVDVYKNITLELIK